MCYYHGGCLPSTLPLLLVHSATRTATTMRTPTRSAPSVEAQTCFVATVSGSGLVTVDVHPSVGRSTHSASWCLRLWDAGPPGGTPFVLNSTFDNPHGCVCWQLVKPFGQLLANPLVNHWSIQNDAHYGIIMSMDVH